MRIFLSWSGEKSKHVAEALRDWLPDVIQGVKPWMSAADIAAGARWGTNIQHQLAESRFGLLCVTRKNQAAPWLVFEAGALAKTVDDTYVCPYLVDLAPAELSPGPLTQFQSKVATEEGTRDLVRTVNRAAKDHALPEDKIDRAFTKWWPELRDKLAGAPTEVGDVARPRPIEDMIQETLMSVREIQRTSRVSPVGLFQPFQAFVKVSTREQRAEVAREIRQAFINVDDETLLTPEFWAGFVGGFIDSTTQAEIAELILSKKSL